MDIEGARQQLADRRAAAGFVHRVGIPRLEQQLVRPAAAIRIATEERADIPLQRRGLRTVLTNSGRDHRRQTLRPGGHQGAAPALGEGPNEP